VTFLRWYLNNDISDTYSFAFSVLYNLLNFFFFYNIDTRCNSFANGWYIGLARKFFRFFSLKLYIQYFRQKWMKFKFKKKDFKSLKSLLSEAYHIFWVYVSLIIFTYRKLYELKKMENFLLTLLVCNVPKLNLKKFLTILWKLEAFPTKSFFTNVPTIFCS